MQDGLIRLMTHGKYSHCEIVVFKREFEIGERYPVEWVDCYSSSPRDGGVRCKSLQFIDESKWELILLPNLTEKQVYDYFQQTKGKAYDWCGVLGLFLGLRQNQAKYFCSEWCYNLIFGSQQGWRFSPNQLREIVLLSRGGIV